MNNELTPYLAHEVYLELESNVKRYNWESYDGFLDLFDEIILMILPKADTYVIERIASYAAKFHRLGLIKVMDNMGIPLPVGRVDTVSRHSNNLFYVDSNSILNTSSLVTTDVDAYTRTIDFNPF